MAVSYNKLCKTLNVDFGDIVEYVPDAEIWDLYNENRELLGKDHVREVQVRRYLKVLCNLEIIESTHTIVSHSLF